MPSFTTFHRSSSTTAPSDVRVTVHVANGARRGKPQPPRTGKADWGTPDSKSLNHMLRDAAKSGEPQRVVACLAGVMKDPGFVPDQSSLQSVMLICASKADFDQMNIAIGLLERAGLKDVAIRVAIRACAMRDRDAQALAYFDLINLPDKPLAPDIAKLLIQSAAKCGEYKLAIQCFDVAHACRMTEALDYGFVLKACANLGRPNHARSYLQQMEADGVAIGAWEHNPVMWAYIEARNPLAAIDYFDKVMTPRGIAPNQTTIKTLITALGMVGDFDGACGEFLKALASFKDPDEGLISGMTQACQSCGKPDAMAPLYDAYARAGGKLTGAVFDMLIDLFGAAPNCRHLVQPFLNKAVEVGAFQESLGYSQQWHQIDFHRDSIFADAHHPPGVRPLTVSRAAARAIFLHHSLRIDDALEFSVGWQGEGRTRAVITRCLKEIGREPVGIPGNPGAMRSREIKPRD
jgi:pentatricopeptide repeat protein